MFYSGTYIDLFECAMRILFIKKGYGAIPHLDAMGKRCFGFCNGGEGKGYYIPIVGIAEAVGTIAEYTKLEGKLTIQRLETAEEFMEYAAEGIVYGPIKEVVAIRQVKNLYYRAENRYMYIQAESEGGYCVTDPDGFPVLYYREQEMRALFCHEKGIVIRLQENEGMHSHIEDIETIWRNGWEFHGRVVTQQRTTLCKDAFKGYNGSASSQIALRYGVINFLENVEKIRNLGYDLGRVEKRSNLRKMQCEMLEIAECGQVDRLPSVEAEIWKELYEI